MSMYKAYPTLTQQGSKGKKERKSAEESSSVEIDGSDDFSLEGLEASEEEQTDRKRLTKKKEKMSSSSGEGEVDRKEPDSTNNKSTNAKESGEEDEEEEVDEDEESEEVEDEPESESEKEEEENDESEEREEKKVQKAGKKKAPTNRKRKRKAPHFAKPSPRALKNRSKRFKKTDYDEESEEEANEDGIIRDLVKRAGFDPDEMMEKEKELFPNYVDKYQNYYLNMRNLILTRWKQDVHKMLTLERAQEGVKVLRQMFPPLTLEG